MAKRKQQRQRPRLVTIKCKPDVYKRLRHFQTVTMQARSASDAIDYLVCLAERANPSLQQRVRELWLEELAADAEPAPPST